MAEVEAMRDLQSFLRQVKEFEDDANEYVDAADFGLSKEKIALVRSAGQRTAELFKDIAPLEKVMPLVAAIAEESGGALLALLQKSQYNGEDIMTRLTELVEGALTHETLEDISLANAWLQPLVVAGKIVNLRSPGGAVHWQMEWSTTLHRKVMNAENLKDLGGVVVEILRQLFQNETAGGYSVDRIMDSIRSALRHGRVVEQKIEEAENDSAAVCNVIKGMMGDGRLVLQASPCGTAGFVIQAEYNFKQSEVVLDEQSLTECADKAMLAVPQAPRQQDEEPTGDRISPAAVALFTQVGCNALPE